MQLEAKLCWNQQPLQLLALVDSVADENFLDIHFAAQAGIATEPLEIPIDANALNGKLLTRITHHTKPLHLILSGNHSVYIQFHLISSPLSPIVLVQPWLIKHNPHIDWSISKVVSWESFLSVLVPAICPSSSRGHFPTQH